MSGVLITFEGPDASGKTTQIHLLEETLRQNNIEPLLTREPGEGLCIPSLTFCNDHMLGSELLASPPATFLRHISCCHIRPFLSSAP